jgi:cyanophycinase
VRKGFVLLLAVGALVQAAALASGAERMVLVGGGDRPREAMARFVDWAGGQVGSRILVAVWGAADAKEGFEACRADLLPYKPELLESAPPLPLTSAGRTTFLAQLGRATGIFFAGADAGRLMEALRDPEILALVRARYQAGVVLGGTGAGMAIMAERLIAGEGDPTVIDASKLEVRAGLGFLRGAFLEPHFVKRQRGNRLFGLVLANPEERGIGVDEATALLVEDGRRAEVVGASVVVLVDPGAERGTLTLKLLRAGSTFEIARPR